MPSEEASNTGLYCGQCGRDMPASRLAILFSRAAPSELVPNPDWHRVGRYCDKCMLGEIEMELGIGEMAEVKAEPFVPRPIEGSNPQVRK